MALFARLVLAVIIAAVVWLLCGLFGPMLVDLHAKFAVDIGRWLVVNREVLAILAGLAYFFLGFLSTSRWFRPTSQ